MAKKKEPWFYMMEIKSTIGFRTVSITDIVRGLDAKGYATVRKYLDKLIEEGTVARIRVDGKWKYKVISLF